MTLAARSSATNWCLVHIGIPILPFLLGSAIRVGVACGQLSWKAFSSSDLAICLALLSLLMNQSLLRSERILDNEDKKEEVEGRATFFLILAMVLIALFSVIVALDSVIENYAIRALEPPLRIFEIATYLLMPTMLYLSIQTQRSYKLKVNMP